MLTSASWLCGTLKVERHCSVYLLLFWVPTKLSLSHLGHCEAAISQSSRWHIGKALGVRTRLMFSGHMRVSHSFIWNQNVGEQWGYKLMRHWKTMEVVETPFVTLKAISNLLSSLPAMCPSGVCLCRLSWTISQLPDNRNRWWQKIRGGIPPTTKPCSVHWWRKLNQNWEKRSMSPSSTTGRELCSQALGFWQQSLKNEHWSILTEKQWGGGVSDTVKWTLIFELQMKLCFEMNRQPTS